ncbi:MAG: 1-deoxy-D-xylulose-5-phosphate reductoisomerase [Verrucomicrobiales bacterium]|nr:1-deoxy-D-xylulose-5-phosphate reductoisomerase [Verrucomicrobiales bacterium]|tara:strand:- start:11453 stop:12613 length:1161 start_codon:yes stop_codon:yes gene_type:complete
MAETSAPKKVVVLGSTGSIGESTLSVARDIPDRMKVIALAANNSVESIARQIAEFDIKQGCLYDQRGLDQLKSHVGDDVTLHSGEDGLIELATLPEADMVLIAIVGVAGLRPALAAIEAGKDIAVASKEILVMAGETVMSAARKKGVRVLPVDSEHNAIFQCLEDRSSKDVSRLILTASGGPFRQLPSHELASVTKAQALKHPTWEMGQKITIDSATLFNKGLEMIEARWLFDIEMQRVDVIVHPQSIIHSMVEFIDNSILAQLSTTDMCFPIQYAVTWPDRVPNTLPPLNFSELAKLEFEAPRWEDFPALSLAKEAGEKGGTLPAVMNAANEVAVSAFLRESIPFPKIWEMVGATMASHHTINQPGLDEIIDADLQARAKASELI